MPIDPNPNRRPPSLLATADEKTDDWHAHEHGEDRIDHGLDAEFACVYDHSVIRRQWVWSLSTMQSFHGRAVTTRLPGHALAHRPFRAA